MSHAEPIGFTLIGGYLGAGKTTLLNHLLQTDSRQPEASRRIAVLINDFGAINIDASLIEKQTDSQINLTNGCVCCGLSDGFDRAIEQLLAQPTKPDHIIVEASGVADVATLSQYGQAPELELDGVLVVADAETIRAKATDKYVAKTVTRQLAAADLILLNKVDLITDQTRAELTDWLGQYLPNELVIPTSYCDVPLDLLIGTGRAHRGTAHASGPAESSDPAEQADHPPSHNHQYLSWHFESNARFSRQQVRAFLTALPATVLRGKGWFAIDAPHGATRQLWQRVGARETLVQSDVSAAAHSAPQTQIVAIAQASEVTAAELDRIAATHLGS